VLHSQDARTLARSWRVLRPGGRLVSISGPPDPAFADELGAPWYLKRFMQLASFRTRRTAKRLGTEFSFLFMKASGAQLQALAELVDAGAIRPVVDKVFPFASTNEAIRYVETGRAKGKIVITMR